MNMTVDTPADQTNVIPYDLLNQDRSDYMVNLYKYDSAEEVAWLRHELMLGLTKAKIITREEIRATLSAVAALDEYFAHLVLGDPIAPERKALALQTMLGRNTYEVTRHGCPNFEGYKRYRSIEKYLKS